MIPAFLCIDVEHDELAPAIGDRPWEGFASVVELVDRLRGPLAERSGTAPHPTWFFRIDPIVERCFGRLDFAVHRHRDLVEHLSARGDFFGLHVHSLRWDEERGLPYTDYADIDWACHCVTVAADTFEQCFGRRPERFRHGGYFLPEPVVDTMLESGVVVDLTAEPGVAPRYADPSFGAFATAPSTDFSAFPRRPYRPSRSDVGRPAVDDDDARPLVMIPLTSYDYGKALDGFARGLAKRLLGRPRGPPPLNLWKAWPDPRTYWDLVSRAIDESPVPYVSMAIRSDPPESLPAQRVRALLEYLPNHPISKRLEFTDPLVFWPVPPPATR
jgi:hypothetical protein